MAMKEVTPQQAYDVLQRDPGAVYIDVRTEHEFAAGHPQGAVNIPVAFPDPATRYGHERRLRKGRGRQFSQRKEINPWLPSRATIQCRGGIAAAGGLSRHLQYGRGFWRDARFAGQSGSARLVDVGIAREPGQRRWRELPVAFSEGCSDSRYSINQPESEIGFIAEGKCER